MIELVKEQEVDVIALEEVDDLSKLAQFAEESGLYHFVHCDIEFDLCNVICSRYPIQSSAFVPIGDGRNAQLVVIEAPTTSGESFIPLRLVATHLDHMYEPLRVAEWATLREEARRRWENRFFVLGDFNALHRQDYSDAYWAEITAKREMSRWEPPRSSLMESLLSPAEEGGEGMVDSLCAGGTEEKASGNVTGTCRFHTRIDCILQFLSERCRWKFRPGSYKVVPSTASDHSLVLVDIEQVPDEERE